MRLYQLDHAALHARSEEALIALLVPGFCGAPPVAMPGDPAFDCARDAFAGGCYVHVADIDSADPEFAFRHTQHIDEDWTENPPGEITVVQGAKARSTSVGDIVEIEGTYMLVAGVGFRTLSPAFAG